MRDREGLRGHCHRRQPDPDRPRSDRACRNPGDPAGPPEAIGTERLVDCDLYVTLEPCTMCAGRDLVRADSGGCITAPPTRRAARSISGVRFFGAADLPSCAGGVFRGGRGAKAATLLKEFFKVRR